MPSKGREKGGGTYLATAAFDRGLTAIFSTPKVSMSHFIVGTKGWESRSKFKEMAYFARRMPHPGYYL